MSRTDTAANWAASNAVLPTAEQGKESDTGLEKRGDGRTPWNDLPYAPSQTGHSTLLRGDAYSKLDIGLGNVVVDDYLWNFTPSSLRKFKKALAKTRLGTGDTKILCAGDSNTLGYGTSDASRTSKNSWNAQLSRMMAAAGLPAVEGMTAPQVSGVILDNRLATTGTWDNAAATASLGWGSNGGIKGYWFSQVDASTRTFTPGIPWDKADIYYLTHTGSGNATVTPTGGSALNITVGGLTLVNCVVQKSTITAASVADTNTVTITKSGTGPVWILGIDVWNSTKSQIRIANAGIASSSAFGWNTFSVSYPNLRSGKCIEAFTPDLTIISLGSNDANISSRDLPSYLNDIRGLIANAQVSGDVILMSSWPYGVNDPVKSALIDSYAVGLRGLGVPYIDIHTKMGAYAPYLAAGYMNVDGLHGNDYAANEVAQWVFSLLRSV